MTDSLEHSENRYSGALIERLLNDHRFVQVGAEKADRVYEDLTDTQKIRSVLQDYLDDYNVTFAKDTKLVFFQDAIEHVSR